VNVGNAQESITLSNADCLFFKQGNSTTQFLDENSPVIHILIGGQVNENLGVIKQDGDTLFHQHFSILPHGSSFNQSESMRFSLEHQNPLVAGKVHGSGTWTEKEYSFFNNDNPNTILWTIKPGEDEGLIIRIWNLESKPAETRATFGLPLQKAMLTSHVETDISEIPVASNSILANLNQHQLKTFHIWLKEP
jgi:alpha-mannosidase